MIKDRLEGEIIDKEERGLISQLKKRKGYPRRGKENYQMHSHEKTGLSSNREQLSWSTQSKEKAVEGAWEIPCPSTSLIPRTAALIFKYLPSFCF